MDRKKQLKNSSSLTFYNQIIDLHSTLDNLFNSEFSRSLPFNETIIDRWERAKKLGFGDDTSIYDSAFVFGKIKVGKNCWIGPFTILDGSGELEIGNFCTISSGVHIYSHDNVKQTLSSGEFPIEREKVKIGNNVYIGPNAIITKGVTIGDRCVISANAFVNKNIPDNSIVMGQPAKIKGNIVIKNNEIKFVYF